MLSRRNDGALSSDGRERTGRLAVEWRAGPRGTEHKGERAGRGAR